MYFLADYYASHFDFVHPRFERKEQTTTQKCDPRKTVAQCNRTETIMSVHRDMLEMKSVNRSEMIEIDYDARTQRCTVMASSHIQGARLIHCVVLVESRKNRNRRSQVHRHDTRARASRSGRGRSCHGHRSSRQRPSRVRSSEVSPCVKVRLVSDQLYQH